MCVCGEWSHSETDKVCKQKDVLLLTAMCLYVYNVHGCAGSNGPRNL